MSMLIFRLSFSIRFSFSSSFPMEVSHDRAAALQRYPISYELIVPLDDPQEVLDKAAARTGRPYPEDIDRNRMPAAPAAARRARCRRQRIYDSLADPRGGSLRGLRGRGIHLHSRAGAPHAAVTTIYARAGSASVARAGDPA